MHCLFLVVVLITTADLTLFLIKHDGARNIILDALLVLSAEEVFS